MKYLWYLLPFLLHAEESFMSHYEYGQMLYNNPRGVSCAKCHGVKGEGKKIVSYRDKKGTHTIKGSDIRHEDLKTLRDTLRKNHKIMPRYYLTDEEVEAIHDYIHAQNEEE
jgi:mono/diheme cytochrome c family protein